MQIDEIDRQIITLTQAGLPLTPQPYQTIADQLKLPVKTVLQRMKNMQQTGVIRRIGVVPNHYSLGYKFNGMTVWNIVDEQIDQLGQQVGELDFVSHCYHRPRHEPEWNYNLFAMIHSKTETGVKQKIETIEKILGNYNLGQDVLFSTRILKKTGLRIKP